MARDLLGLGVVLALHAGLVIAGPATPDRGDPAPPDEVAREPRGESLFSPLFAPFRDPSGLARGRVIVPPEHPDSRPWPDGMLIAPTKKFDEGIFAAIGPSSFVLPIEAWMQIGRSRGLFGPVRDFVRTLAVPGASL